MHYPVMTEKHVADRWQVSLKTLQRWRLDGAGPVWHKLFRHVRYHEADVLEYRDMVTIIRDRVQDRMKKGQTLAQIKAAGLTKDWDQRYGNPDNFIEAIVTSLAPKKK